MTDIQLLAYELAMEVIARKRLELDNRALKNEVRRLQTAAGVTVLERTDTAGPESV